ncbi:MAG: aminoacyl-tRNA hydrolase [Bacilli bacterium]|nr:aminoacyl-tRNA hydrolase [Bacilli bacterium]
MKLIVGLGNPGKEYENTRHNVGFMALDYFLGNISYNEKFNALYTKVKIDNEDVLFIKPLTYMNLSGQAVSRFVNFFKISTDDILIIQDDLDLPTATIKLKYKSSSGGHNGIKSIINELNTDEIPRLKIGISNNKLISTKDYVLNRFSKDELHELENVFPQVKDIINLFIKTNINECMSKYNSR